jgi:Zn-dependent M28 family amino/carboxypeptidase
MKKGCLSAAALALIKCLLLLAIPVLSYAGEKEKHPVNTERLKEDVAFLTGLPGGRNWKNLSALNAAADYILQEFQKTGATVTEQTYTVQGKEYRNISAIFGPPDGERIVIGAHYDVFGPFPGADDNASGTAGLLEIGRMLTELNPHLKTPVELVAYTLEEPPFFSTEMMGSYIHAQSLKEAGTSIKKMISLEMIGYFTDKKGSQKFPARILKLFYPGRGNFITVVGDLKNIRTVRRVKKRMKAGSQIKVRSINSPRWIEGIDFSDHRNYWHFGFRAVMVTNTAFYRNKNYHQPSDTKETLDYAKMAEVVRGVYNVIVKTK